VASLGANLTLWAVLTLGVAWLVAEGRRATTDPVDHQSIPSGL